jgi:hypothetical protein
MAYDKIQSTPFTCTNGRPTQSNYELLKCECSERASKIKDIVFPWCSDNATGKEYGFLANILGRNVYNDLAAINIGNIPEQLPALYDLNIDDNTPMHQWKWMEEEWDKKLTSWYIRKGFLKGTAANLRNALNKQYYHSSVTYAQHIATFNCWWYWNISTTGGAPLMYKRGNNSGRITTIHGNPKNI